MAAAMQVVIALLTAGLDAPELEAWAADALTPVEPSGAILQRLAILAERRRGDTVRRL